MQTIQNTASNIATSCTRDTNTQYPRDETKVLPMGTHLKLHATQLKQLTQTQTRSAHDFNAYSDPPRNIKPQSFITMSTLTSSSQNQT